LGRGGKGEVWGMLGEARGRLREDEELTRG
jgi:hypothetical protein